MVVRIVKVDTSALKRRFAKMSKRSKDFKAVFRWVFQELQRSHYENFKSEGALSGFRWQPLQPQYAAWKLEHYGAHGILVRTGALESSLSFSSARGAVRDIGLTSATFGTSIPYAAYHKFGTRRMPMRPPIFVPNFMATRTANVVAEYIVHGSVGVVYSEAMRGFSI